MPFFVIFFTNLYVFTILWQFILYDSILGHSVRIGSNQIAEVEFNGQWVPICGHYFWDNQVGAELFCQKMGYDSGQLSGRGSGKKYSTDSFRIGKCNGGNNWGKCKGGCNDYEVGVACNNNKYAKCYCINQKHEIERFQNS